MQSVQSFSKHVDHLAAKLLAAAICLRCPTAQILEARGESYGFCAEFYSSETCSEELFPFLEEGVYALLNQKEIQTFEMTSSNAYDFLRFHHQKRRAQILKEWTFGLVDTIKIGGYVDFLEEALPLAETIEELKAIKLISLTRTIEKGVNGESRHRYRIKGLAAADIRSLKEIVKRVKEVHERPYNKATHLFTIVPHHDGEALLWLPQGLILKNKLLNGLKNHLRQTGCQEVESPEQSLDLIFSVSQLQEMPAFFATYEESTRLSSEPGLGLYSLERALSLVSVSFCLPNTLARVFKNMLDKALELMNSMQWTVRLEREIESDTPQKTLFFVKDSLEREWEIARLEIGEKKKSYYVMLSLISIERWLALFIDYSQGVTVASSLDKIFKSDEEKRYQENS